MYGGGRHAVLVMRRERDFVGAVLLTWKIVGSLPVCHCLREAVTGLGRFDCVCSCEHVDGLSSRRCPFDVDWCWKSRTLM
jgi:hypothetical protein